MDKIGQQRPDDFDETLLHEILETNLVGTMRVTKAFLPLLVGPSKEAKRLSRAGSVVFVSTDMASTTIMSSAVSSPQSPLRHLLAVSYNASKAALNSYAVAVATH